MEINFESIPKVFWYALSFCMVSITVSLIVLAFRSQEIVLNFHNTRVELSGTITDVQNAYNQLQQKQALLETKRADLEAKNKALQDLLTNNARWSHDEFSPAKIDVDLKSDQKLQEKMNSLMTQQKQMKD